MPLFPGWEGTIKEECACFQNKCNRAAGWRSAPFEHQRTDLASVPHHEAKINISTHVTYFIMYLHFALQKKLIQIQYMPTFQI